MYYVNYILISKIKTIAFFVTAKKKYRQSAKKTDKVRFLLNKQINTYKNLK